MVEAAIVFPLLALLTFAVIDGGLFFKSYLTLGYAATAGARAGTAAGTDPLADYDLLQSIKGSIGALDKGSTQRIVVFKANSFQDRTPMACLNPGEPSGVAGLCNVYVEGDMSRDKADFGGGGPWTGDQNWAALSRNANRTTGPDLVGVSIEAHISTPVGVLGKTDWLITRTAIMQVEARTS